MSTGIEMDTGEVCAELVRRGFAGAEVSFSGGNDSGGAEQITLIREDATTSEINRHWTSNLEWDAKQQRYVRIEAPPLTPEQLLDNKIWEVLEAPVYDRWGSFAGDFQVEGTVTWDLAEGSWSMSGQEQVWQESDW